MKQKPKAKPAPVRVEPAPAQFPQARLACSLLALVTLLLYWPVADHEFINFDDPRYVTENTEVRRGLSPEGIVWAFADTHFYMWHPLTTISHMLDVTLFGLNPAPHHLMSVFIHTANVVLLFLLLLRMTNAFWPAVITAFLFAWHPLRVESVAWVAERKDVLCGLFWLLTLMAYSRYVRNPSSQRYWFSVFVYGLAILTKPMIVTLPFTLLVLDFWPLNRIAFDSRGRPDSSRLLALLKEKLPFFALSLVLGTITFLAQKGGDVVKPLDEYTLVDRFSNALVSYVRYLGKAIWPTDLIVFYPHEGAWAAWQTFGALLVLVGITVFVIRSWRERPYLIAGWCWFLGTLIPVIGIVQVGGQAMADRYTYMPLVGIVFAAVWGIANSPLRTHPQLLGGLAALAALGCLATTRVQLSYWQTSETLFSHVLRVDRENPIGRVNYTGALLDQKRYEEVIGILNEAVTKYPDEPRGWLHLGLAHVGLGNIQEGMRCYRETLRIDPKNTIAMNNLANVLMRIGRPQEAVAIFEEISRIDPTDAQLLNNWGLALADTGKTTEAIEKYNAAIAMDPRYAKAHQNLGLLLAQLGQTAEAESHYRTALALEPDFVEARASLGYLLAVQKKHPEAVAEFLKTLEFDPEFVEAHAGAGICLAALNRYPEAIAHFREAARLDPGNPFRVEQIAMALRRSGDLKGALAEYRAAAQARPNDPMALNQLAWFLSTAPAPELRNGEEAARFAQRACELTQNKVPDPVDTLAMAQAEMGRFAEARETATRALELAKKATNNTLAAAIEKRLELYQQGKPFHETK